MSENYNFLKFISSKNFLSFKKDLAKDIKYKTHLIDSNKDSFGTYGTIHSTTLISNIAILSYILSKEKGVFLDLGCGIGVPLIQALKYNWKAIGIDISKGCIECSKKNIEKSFESDPIKNLDYEINNCSFFPNNFNVIKIKNSDNDDFRDELEKLSLQNRNCINPETFNDVDLFYHYQVENKQNILNLFSNYGKNSSKLIIVSTRNDKFEIPKNVKRIDEYNDVVVFKRT